jgi:hypothetical protein
MKIVPVNFNSEHKTMLGHCKMILEHEPRKIAINPDKFDKLITALRTAVDNDGVLDKEATSYNDIFDAFRLALKFYHFKETSNEYSWLLQKANKNYYHIVIFYSIHGFVGLLLLTAALSVNFFLYVAGW